MSFIKAVWLENLGTGRSLLFLCHFVFWGPVFSASIINGRVLSLDKDILFQYPSGIVVVGNQAIISDRLACKLAVISLKDGKQVREFGRLGVGPDEFSTPTIRDYANGELAITDLGRNVNHFYFFEKASSHFTFSHQYGKGGSIIDIKIVGRKKYLLSALSDLSPKDGKTYVLSEIKMPNEKRFILDIDESFGEKTDFNKKIRSTLHPIIHLPTFNMCDFNERWYLYNWAGNLEPIVIERKSLRKITLRIRMPARYKKPRNYHAFEKAVRKLEKGLYWREMEKYSWVMYNFLTDRSIGLVYADYTPSQKAWRFRLALYSHAGEMLLDRELTGIAREGMLDWPGLFYFDHKIKILYGLAHELTEDLDEQYSIVSYRVLE